MSDDAIERLSLVLWRERELLESLRYKLEVEELVMASGRTTWLARAAHEVEQVLQVIRETETLRAVAAEEAGAWLGLPPNPSLSALVEAAAEPWDSILADHREAFAAVTEDIIRLADANRSLISAGFRSARETLLSLDAGLSTYTPDGQSVTDRVAASRLDRTL